MNLHRKILCPFLENTSPPIWVAHRHPHPRFSGRWPTRQGCFWVQTWTSSQTIFLVASCQICQSFRKKKCHHIRNNQQGLQYISPTLASSARGRRLAKAKHSHENDVDLYLNETCWVWTRPRMRYLSKNIWWVISYQLYRCPKNLVPRNSHWILRLETSPGPSHQVRCHEKISLHGMWRAANLYGVSIGKGTKGTYWWFRNPGKSLVEGKVVEIPLFTRFWNHPKWLVWDFWTIKSSSFWFLSPLRWTSVFIPKKTLPEKHRPSHFLCGIFGPSWYGSGFDALPLEMEDGDCRNLYHNGYLPP